MTQQTLLYLHLAADVHASVSSITLQSDLKVCDHSTCLPRYHMTVLLTIFRPNYFPHVLIMPMSGEGDVHADEQHKDKKKGK